MVRWEVHIVVEFDLGFKKYIARTKQSRLGRKVSKVSNNGRRNVRKAVTSVHAQSQRAVSVLKDTILLSSAISGPSRIPAAPFPHLLISNDPPTEHEATIIRQAIATAEEEMRLLSNLKSSEVEPGLITKQKLDYAARYISQHKAVISHIRRLPVELLEEIFKFYNSCPFDHFCGTRWELGHICRSWRTAAVAMPWLWSQLSHIYFHRSKSASATRRVRELLSRSRDLPINFAAHIPLEAIGPDHFHPALTLLTEQSTRWKAVSIECDDLSLTFSALHTIKNRLPILEKLFLHNNCQRISPIKDIDLLHDAPSLREVGTGGTYFGPITLPFAQLTGYSEYLVLGSILDLTVRTAASLEWLEIGCDMMFLNTDPLTLPCLKSLRIDLNSILDNPEQTFVASLTLPAIERLSITSYQTRLLPTLTALLLRAPTSCLSLARLYLRVYMEWGELTELLKHTPNLTHLNINMPPVDDLWELSAARREPSLLRRDDSSSSSSSVFDPSGPRGDLHHLLPMLESLIIYPNHLDELQSISVVNTLNAIGNVRCEPLPPVPNDDDASYDPWNPRPTHRRLSVLRVIFESPGACYHQYPFLERVTASDVVRSIYPLIDRLIQEIPEFRGISDNSKKPSLTARQRGRVMKILDELETVDLKGDVGAIIVSHIHLYVKRLSEPSFQQKAIEERARSILDQWTPLLMSYLDRRKWVVKGNHSLVYLPQDDLSRTTLDSLYGIPDSENLNLLFLP